MQLALAPQAPGVLGALAHRLAAFQHDGLEAHLRQHQRGKDAAGPETHHHGPQRQIGGRLANRLPGHVGRGLDVRAARVPGQQHGFARRVGQGQVDDVDRQQVGLARIEAALVHVHAGNVGRGDAQDLDGLGAQRVQWMFGGVGRHGGQRQLDFGKADHGLAGPCRSGGGNVVGLVF